MKSTSLLVAAMFAANASSALPDLKNGNMTDGSGKPAHWEAEWIASGKISVARDTTVYHSDPASLRVESVGGAARGQAQQNLDVKGGGKFHAEAWVMADGGATAMFAVQSYDANWKGLVFTPVGNALSGFDWQHAKGDVEIPANAAHLALICTIEGNGRAWLDDVSVSEIGAEPPAIVSTKPPTKAPQQKSATEAVVAPPKPANAWSPGEGFWKDYPKAWLQTANGQIGRAKQGGIDVVFIGDSLTQGWDKEIWSAKFEPLHAVNFGIGGDGTPQVLWRIEHGILDGYTAKLVVMMIGINNTWPGYSADDSIKGIETTIAAIRAKQPQAKILLLGLLPAREKENSIRTLVTKINAGIAKLDDGRTLRFLDMGGQFRQTDGSLRPELYKPDQLHLSEAGYKVWADAMDPLFKNLLEKK